MANDRDRPSLRDFNPYADRNGQDLGQDSPLDVAHPADLQKHLNEDPGGEAETARLASDRARLDSIAGGSIETSEATAAETPPERIRRLGDASLPKGKSDADETIERATSGLGKP
jgi:hypothetical protein